jgi:transcriptional antiterminator NusG
MEEERFDLEVETIEVEDVPEDAQEEALDPEDRARQLFASILEPPKDEPEQVGAQVEEQADPAGKPDVLGELEQALLVDDAAEGEGSQDVALPDEASQVDVSQSDAQDAVEALLPDAEDSDEEAEEGGRNWFVIHSYSGYENKVKKNLEHRIESLDMQNKIFEVVVPTEEEIELKDGQRRTVERRIFPGYILVDMIMDEDSWYVVRNTPGVTGFVGSIRKPTPLRQRDVDRILKRMRAETPRVKVTFLPGQKVRIADGPFEDFVGAVDEIYPDKGKVRILVSFFGRETPVELDFLQVEKI